MALKEVRGAFAGVCRVVVLLHVAVQVCGVRGDANQQREKHTKAHIFQVQQTVTIVSVGSNWYPKPNMYFRFTKEDLRLGEPCSEHTLWQ